MNNNSNNNESNNKNINYKEAINNTKKQALIELKNIQQIELYLSNQINKKKKEINLLNKKILKIQLTEKDNLINKDNQDKLVKIIKKRVILEINNIKELEINTKNIINKKKKKIKELNIKSAELEIKEKTRINQIANMIFCEYIV